MSARRPLDRTERPAPLPVVLAITFLGSISSGGFWAGIFFVTASWYQFSPVRNLALAAVMGGVYAVAAAVTGEVVRLVRRWFSPRGALAVTLCVWALAAVAPLLSPRGEFVVWGAAVVGAAASAMMFPIIESYLTAGRHGADIRGAIGWFNVTWTPASAIPLLIIPMLAQAGAVLWALALCGVANVLACVLLPGLARAPLEVAPDSRAGGHPREYPHLLRAASWLLPLSYVMCSSLAPILPHRLHSLGATTAASLIAAIWMLARFTTLFAMWRTGFWHGRWPPLAAGGGALIAGMTGVLVGGTLPVVVLGLVVFGIGMGLTYYAALYYSLAIGHGAVAAGGSFEALIGVGYCVGPLVGLAAHGMSSRGTGDPEAVTVGLVFAICIPLLLRIVRSYGAARASR